MSATVLTPMAHPDRRQRPRPCDIRTYPRASAGNYGRRRRRARRRYRALAQDRPRKLAPEGGGGGIRTLGGPKGPQPLSRLPRKGRNAASRSEPVARGNGGGMNLSRRTCPTHSAAPGSDAARALAIRDGNMRNGHFSHQLDRLSPEQPLISGERSPSSASLLEHSTFVDDGRACALTSTPCGGWTRTCLRRRASRSTSDRPSGRLAAPRVYDVATKRPERPPHPPRGSRSSTLARATPSMSALPRSARRPAATLPQRGGLRRRRLHCCRLRLLHAWERSGELCVSELAAAEAAATQPTGA